MRHGRAKAARRTLQFFRLNVGIRPPYHVLCDGCFLVAAISQKVPLRDRLHKVLQHAAFTLCVTRSSLKELETLYAHTKKDVFQQARQFGLDECETILEERDVLKANDDDNDNEANDTLGPAGMDVCKLTTTSHPVDGKNNNKHYIVATQDESLLDMLRFRGTVPLIRLARGVVLLENPSKAGQARAAKLERHKSSTVKGNSASPEDALVQFVKQEQAASTKHQSMQQQRTKHKKAKGPNPLSCKKKKRTHDEADGGSSSSPKRKRRRKKNSNVANKDKT